MTGQWIPITEALPMPGVLVEVMGEYTQEMEQAPESRLRIDLDRWRWECKSYKGCVGITHWWLEDEK